MIFTHNTAPHQVEFEKLLDNTLAQLKVNFHKSPQLASSYEGSKFEPYLKDILDEMAHNTPFQNTIELIGGQRFPDIVAKKYYGIEVKTTIKDHWKTTGNSVLESTRVEGVERIYMFFAKLGTPVQFKCRPYHEVLSEVVVTHSPRYQIDMNLEKGQSIFDKMDIKYDELRNQQNPIKPIMDYYRAQLSDGEELWWLDTDTTIKPSNIIIKLWSALSKQEKAAKKIKAMCFFPEIFGNSIHKFGRIAAWLTIQEGIVCHNVRDSFTAGGQGIYHHQNETLRHVPKVIINLLENIDEIKKVLSSASPAELSHYWQIQNVNNKNKIQLWIEEVVLHSSTLKFPNQGKLEQILESKLLP
jgi:hypothetical protein